MNVWRWWWKQKSVSVTQIWWLKDLLIAVFSMLALIWPLDCFAPLKRFHLTNLICFLSRVSLIKEGFHTRCGLHRPHIVTCATSWWEDITSLYLRLFWHHYSSDVLFVIYQREFLLYNFRVVSIHLPLLTGMVVMVILRLGFGCLIPSAQRLFCDAFCSPGVIRHKQLKDSFILTRSFSDELMPGVRHVSELWWMEETLNSPGW